MHHYYDYRTQQYRQQTLSQEEMIGRYISHIPAKHFKMVHYYGFLANRQQRYKNKQESLGIKCTNPV
ncbi:hypothetical protein A3N58_03305 [Klebsiella aerogenes]|nr:hypothetical protein A3N58_03305 [Klebsiella aerogenes]